MYLSPCSLVLFMIGSEEHSIGSKAWAFKTVRIPFRWHVLLLECVFVLFRVPAKSPAKSDLKAPAKSDPKAPAKSDPKAPAKSDPKAPAKSDPKAPAKSDPKAPAKSDPQYESQVCEPAQYNSGVKNLALLFL